MALMEQHHWYDLTSHRRWEDVASMILGALVIVAPMYLGALDSTLATATTAFLGAMIVAVALLETVSLRRWEEWLEMLCGALLIAAPFYFGYGGGHRNLHVVVGAFVVALALLELWQDRNRDMHD